MSFADDVSSLRRFVDLGLAKASYDPDSICRDNVVCRRTRGLPFTARRQSGEGLIAHLFALGGKLPFGGSDSPYSGGLLVL